MAKKINRIAIVATPRVGNTWVNYSIAELGNIPTIGLHRHTDIENITLPPEILIQIHASYGDKGFKKFLSDNHFRVITVLRHPLDTLISMLRFIQVQTSPLQWLDGSAGTIRLYGEGPSSQHFIDWCLSDEAERLLKISYEWSRSNEVISIRYEDMLDRPVDIISTTLRKLNMKVSKKRTQDVISKYSPDFFRNNANKHSWNATKDNWTNFFTISDANKIYKKHQEIFDGLHYDVKAATNTSREENLAKWDVEADPALSSADWMYVAIKELEMQTKKTVISKIQQEQEIISHRKALEEKDREIDRIRSNIIYLQEEINSITPLQKHVKNALKRRIKRLIKEGE